MLKGIINKKKKAEVSTANSMTSTAESETNETNVKKIRLSYSLC